jgi:hypothetical protein
MTTSLTVLIHWFFQVTPVLIAAIFMQPRMIYGSPFWRIYIRHHSDKMYSELRRPWPEPKSGLPGRWQRQYADFVRKNLDPDAIAQDEAAAAAKKGAGKKGKKRISVN